MLFLLFGSSAAGKSYVLNLLRDRLPDTAVHDFDEIEVPPNADTIWRQRANEVWIRRALDYQSGGTDLLLAGQTPFGELLASPSAPGLEAISGCLLDCADDVRLERLRACGGQSLEQVPGQLDDFFRWASWLRRHASDPEFMTHVIKQEASPPEMRWERWADWKRGDRRWRVRIVDTTRVPVEQVADELVVWMNDERTLFRARGASAVEVDGVVEASGRRIAAYVLVVSRSTQ